MHQRDLPSNCSTTFDRFGGTPMRTSPKTRSVTSSTVIGCLDLRTPEEGMLATGGGSLSRFLNLSSRLHFLSSKGHWTEVSTMSHGRFENAFTHRCRVSSCCFFSNSSYPHQDRKYSAYCREVCQATYPLEFVKPFEDTFAFGILGLGMVIGREEEGKTVGVGR